jgi:hypothetical protein
VDGRVRVILKSGAAFEFDAVDPAVGKDWRGHVGRLSWTRPEDWETDLLYLQRHDVAAMIFTRPREEQSSESPPSPTG